MLSPPELLFSVKQCPPAVNRRHGRFKPQLAQKHRWDCCCCCQVRARSTLPQIGKKDPWAWPLTHCKKHRGRVAAVDISHRLITEDTKDSDTVRSRSKQTKKSDRYFFLFIIFIYVFWSPQAILKSCNLLVFLNVCTLSTVVTPVGLLNHMATG